MSTHKITVDLGQVDYSTLSTEEDFRREARRLLPEAMKKNGKFVAETMWKEMKKQLGLSESEKSKFVREAADNFAKDREQKKQVEDVLISTLKAEKRKHTK